MTTARQPLYGPRAGIDRQRRLAESLIAQGSSTAPVQSPLEGLARALTGVVGGYTGKRADEKAQDLDKQRTTALSRALAGASGQSDVPSIANAQNLTDQEGFGMDPMVKALLGNPETADLGFQVGLSNVQSRRDAAAQRSLLDYKADIASKQPVKLGAGDTLYDPTSQQPLMQVPEKGTDDQREYEAAKAEGFPGTFMDYQTKLREAGKNQFSISMPPQQTEEAKTVGKFYGEQFTTLQTAATQARAQNARMDALDTLLNNVGTGAGAQTMTKLKAAGKYMGIDLEALGITDDVAPAQAAQALASEMALEMRNPAGGAGMPGAMSDQDREMLNGMTPNLAMTQEGRKLLIKVRKATNQRSIEVAADARAYRKDHGSLDEGFYDMLDQKYADKPLLSQEDMVALQAASQAPSQQQGGGVVPPPVGTVEEGHRFMGGDPRDQNNWQKVQ